MNSSFARKISLDLALTVIPESIGKDNLYNESNKRLFELSKWNLELTNWIQFILIQEGLFCPQVVSQSNQLSLGLQFTDDATISTLNSDWRQKIGSTDVLSFSLIDERNFFPTHDCVELGDIVISVPTAYRQSKEYQHDLETELRWLASHGFLHLLGWDHPDEKSLEKMLKMQEQLLDINGNL